MPLVALEALKEFWSHEKQTQWFREHPILSVASLQKQPHMAISSFSEISIRMIDEKLVSMPKVCNPELVIPLRLYGDGAESYSHLISRIS